MAAVHAAHGNFGQTDVFVICFESVTKEFATKLHKQLAPEEGGD